jgi:Lrp/AsnC family leucine-responsive transcriptional regulator
MQIIDKIDKKILNSLQQNNRITAAELGKALHLSTSAVQRRITRLRKEKIIEADVSIISQSVVGRGVTCIVEISLHLGSAKIIEGFKSMLCKCDEVTQCYYVAGNYDFIVTVHTRDMQEYDAFARKYFMNTEVIKQYHTHVVLEKAKSSFTVVL